VVVVEYLFYFFLLEGNLITILVSKVSSPSEEFGNKPKIRGILTAIAKQLQNKLTLTVVLLFDFLSS
jgi:hypothetical protein